MLDSAITWLKSTFPVAAVTKPAGNGRDEEVLAREIIRARGSQQSKSGYLFSWAHPFCVKSRDEGIPRRSCKFVKVAFLILFNLDQSYSLLFLFGCHYPIGVFSLVKLLVSSRFPSHPYVITRDVSDNLLHCCGSHMAIQTFMNYLAFRRFWMPPQVNWNSIVRILTLSSSYFGREKRPLTVRLE